MMDYIFEPAVGIVGVPVHGGGLFPVRRIFCIGRNYADHVREMGDDPKDTPPVFFTKPADAAIAGGGNIPYAQATGSLNYEGELVIALKAGGKDVADEKTARGLIYGYAAGCDLTRRDLQNAAKKAGAPWDTAKAFDCSAPLGVIVPATAAGAVEGAGITTRINGEIRQNAPFTDMIWTGPEIIMALSRLFELKAGDLIFTGTPEGVGPVERGDAVEVVVDGLPPLAFTII